jgi:hypothetical protein
MPLDPIDAVPLDRSEMWDPLEKLAARVVDDPTVPLLIPCEFEFMAHYNEPGLPRIYDYRHCESRRWLQLTATGRIARYVPPADDDDGDGHHVLSRRSLRRTIERLELAEFGGKLPPERYCDACWALINRRRAACMRAEPDTAA